MTRSRTQTNVVKVLRACKAAGAEVESLTITTDGQIQLFFKDGEECQSETREQGSDGSKNGEHFISAGPSSTAAASAQQARQIANKLKRSSPTGSETVVQDLGRVIPLKAS